jgi:CRP/FNR family cyclic AMP-dependent transcriptional regulator
MAILSRLVETSLFSGLSENNLKTVRDLSISRKYLKGEFVSHREDIWPFLFFVQSGEFQAVKESGQGRSFVIEVFTPGEVFWGLALFEKNKPNPMAIQAASDGEILLWHMDNVEQIITADPKFAWGLFNLMAKRMGRAGEIVDELVFLPLPGRLANLLLAMNTKAVDDYITRDLTLDEMAARIGSTREMVCKLLYQFSDKGIIELHRTEFKITDQKQMKEIAERMKG